MAAGLDRVSADVLVAGAGPTGLTAALVLHDHGAAVRIVDRRPAAFRPSRAMIVHPRTLEVLRPLGVTAALLDRGDRSPEAELHLGRRRVRVRLNALDLPDTAFPHLTLLRQMDVEDVLLGALARRGVRVERGTELAGLRAGPGSVTATLRSAAGAREERYRFLAGCDGQASAVRAQAGLGWRGGPYREDALLADLDLDTGLTPGVAHVVAGREGLLMLFALGETAGWRLLATRPRGAAADPRDLLAGAGLDVRVRNVAWSSRIPLQHRLATGFRAGPVFLAGDAAHAHSPAGGQGLNTGIQDAVNLGWKLAYAARHEEDLPALLGSYEQERRPAAKQVLALTHLIFWAEASTGPVPAFLRGTLAPLAAPVIPVAVNRRRLVAMLVRTLSQLRVNYRSSPLSEGIGTPRPGDRLPDEAVRCAGRDVRLHELTAAPGVHVLLHRDARLPEVSGRVAVHRLPGKPGRTIMAVRPDGHVGFRGTDPARLTGWLDRIGAPGG
ncbi:FAD-dependent monooxygenase [Amycolatopsis thermoflava]|uniref:FAD-dependent monooxygenase n=1 Tax=Amycolatopsis thermoflava TaxID=84480 RepID=UPI0038078527